MSAALVISPELTRNVQRWHSAGGRPDLFDGVGHSALSVQLAPTAVPIAIKAGLAIGRARTRNQLEAAAAYARATVHRKLLDADVAGDIENAISEKEGELAARREWWGRIAPPRMRAARNHDRQQLAEYRMKLATAGPMPPELAKQFTVAELAIMKIVADEVTRNGRCVLTKDELCDRALVLSKTTAHNAFRKGVASGLIEVQQRRVHGAKHLPSIVRIVDADWLCWIRQPRYRSIRQDIQQGDPAVAVREAYENAKKYRIHQRACHNQSRYSEILPESERVGLERQKRSGEEEMVL